FRLVGKVTIHFGNHALDGAENIRRDQLGTLERLLSKSANCALNRLLCLGSFRFELLIQERLKLIEFSCLSLWDRGGANSRGSGSFIISHSDERLVSGELEKRRTKLRRLNWELAHQKPRLLARLLRPGEER